MTSGSKDAKVLGPEDFYPEWYKLPEPEVDDEDTEESVEGLPQMEGPNQKLRDKINTAFMAIRSSFGGKPPSGS